MTVRLGSNHDPFIRKVSVNQSGQKAKPDVNKLGYEIHLQQLLEAYGLDKDTQLSTSITADGRITIRGEGVQIQSQWQGDPKIEEICQKILRLAGLNAAPLQNRAVSQLGLQPGQQPGHGPGAPAAEAAAAQAQAEQQAQNAALGQAMQDAVHGLREAVQVMRQDQEALRQQLDRQDRAHGQDRDAFRQQLDQQAQAQRAERERGNQVAQGAIDDARRERDGARQDAAQVGRLREQLAALHERLAAMQQEAHAVPQANQNRELEAARRELSQQIGNLAGLMRSNQPQDLGRLAAQIEALQAQNQALTEALQRQGALQVQAIRDGLAQIGQMLFFLLAFLAQQNQRGGQGQAQAGGAPAAQGAVQPQPAQVAQQPVIVEQHPAPNGAGGIDPEQHVGIQTECAAAKSALARLIKENQKQRKLLAELQEPLPPAPVRPASSRSPSPRVSPSPRPAQLPAASALHPAQPGHSRREREGIDLTQSTSILQGLLKQARARLARANLDLSNMDRLPSYGEQPKISGTRKRASTKYEGDRNTATRDISDIEGELTRRDRATTQHSRSSSLSLTPSYSRLSDVEEGDELEGDYDPSNDGSGSPRPAGAANGTGHGLPGSLSGSLPGSPGLLPAAGSGTNGVGGPGSSARPGTPPRSRSPITEGKRQTGSRGEQPAPATQPQPQPQIAPAPQPATGQGRPGSGSQLRQHPELTPQPLATPLPHGKPASESNVAELHTQRRAAERRAEEAERRVAELQRQLAQRNTRAAAQPQPAPAPFVDPVARPARILRQEEQGYGPARLEYVGALEKQRDLDHQRIDALIAAEIAQLDQDPKSQDELQRANRNHTVRDAVREIFKGRYQDAFLDQDKTMNELVNARRDYPNFMGNLEKAVKEKIEAAIAQRR